MRQVRSIASQGTRPDNGSAKEPSQRQQRVLDAYYDYPNAAAVARAVRMSERQVRRIVENFRPLLEERRRREYEELAEREMVRRAKLAAWADKVQQENLDALDELARSPKEDVRFRALRLRQDLIDRQTLAAMLPSELELALVDKERQAADDVRRIGLEATNDGREVGDDA